MSNRSGLIKGLSRTIDWFSKKKISKIINQKFITSKYAKKFC